MASVQDASVTSASAVLRERCWPAHERLEAHPLAWLLLSDKLTPKSYARVLSRWYQAWQPLEALVLAQAPAQVPQAYRPAPRAHLAAQDLAYLGHELPLQHGLLAPLPQVAGTAWYGVAYVMQGSALGAQVIAAHLHRLLGLQAGLGASFFRCGPQCPGI
ncbi:MAG: biliverdin-producing heme oxygenase [Burkholderiaceae bacterium]|nr:biliverdin-producing heme oxygenase [Burkholderiaceae bacterium]